MSDFNNTIVPSGKMIRSSARVAADRDVSGIDNPRSRAVAIAMAQILPAAQSVAEWLRGPDNRYPGGAQSEDVVTGYTRTQRLLPRLPRTIKKSWASPQGYVTLPKLFGYYHQRRTEKLDVWEIGTCSRDNYAINIYLGANGKMYVYMPSVRLDEYDRPWPHALHEIDSFDIPSNEGLWPDGHDDENALKTIVEDTHTILLTLSKL